MTPIMWNISDILVNHPTLAKVFKLNPMYYIVDGFRNALLDHIWFWEKPLWTLAFWIITLLFFVIGVNVFNRLKVHLQMCYKKREINYERDGDSCTECNEII